VRSLTSTVLTAGFAALVSLSASGAGAETLPSQVSCDRDADEPALTPGQPSDARCMEDAPELAIDLTGDCSDGSNPIYRSAVGVCDTPGILTEEAPTVAPPFTPLRAPLWCDGPSCRPLSAPLASGPLPSSAPQPLLWQPHVRPPALGARAIVIAAAGQAHPGFGQRVERPPR
jgi:hypothetical protein